MEEDYSDVFTSRKKVVLKKPETNQDKVSRLLKLIKMDYANYSKIYTSTLIYDLQANAAFLESQGWRKCSGVGVHLPKDYLQEYYNSYEDFSNKKFSYIEKSLVRNYLSKDGVLGVYFVGKNDIHQAFIKDELCSIHGIHANHLINSGDLFHTRAKINRNQTVYTDFPHYYYDNHKSPKDNWVIPNGETFGIEIEMNFNNALSKLKFTNELHDVLPYWYCERDGSLQDYDQEGQSGIGGLELISPPLNFENLIKESTEVCNILKKYSVKAYKAGEFFGLHVTHSVKSNKQGANFMRYVHSNKLREFWRSVARRNENKYCIYNNNVSNDLINAGEDLSYFTKSYNPDNHYRATCVRENRKAIETRIFASTKGPKTLAATLELIKLTNQFSENDFNVSKYAKFITDNASRNLVGFLKNRGSLGCLEVIDSTQEYDDEQESF